MHRIVARQPILDRYEKVYGYELLIPPQQRGHLANDERWRCDGRDFPRDASS